MIWSASPPFGMVGVSRWPVLLANETASGFTADENWEWEENDKATGVGGDGGTRKVALAKRGSGNVTIGDVSETPVGQQTRKHDWAGFTYTVSMAYAVGPGPTGAWRQGRWRG